MFFLRVLLPLIALFKNKNVVRHNTAIKTRNRSFFYGFFLFYLSYLRWQYIEIILSFLSSIFILPHLEKGVCVIVLLFLLTSSVYVYGYAIFSGEKNIIGYFRWYCRL